MSAAASQPSLPVIEKYEILEEIGHGGMATVYRARDPRLGRDVAIKIIHKHLRENAEVATRFVAEARAAAKLRHPGIVEVYDVSSEDNAERFLVVELVRGVTLRKILARHSELPAEVGAALVLELCAALSHAHEAGIIHRDVKPENVLVELPSDRASHRGRASGPGMDQEQAQEQTPAIAQTHRVEEASGPSSVRRASGAVCREERPSGEGVVKKLADRAEGEHANRKSGRKGRAGDLGVVIKLTDFGIAKVLEAQGVTHTGQVLGSPAHMAPEQIEGGEVDARTDVFALGVLLYECMVGHLPFQGKNPAQVLRKVLEGLYAPPDRERATVGGRWAKILAQALSRTATDRTASPGVLAEQIRAELEALGISDPRTELAAYFEHPAEYAQALPGRLVPRLVQRGEAARKAGDARGAADDFNRALALAPSDLSILKRITSLTSSAARKQLLRRAGLVLAGSAALGIVAFGVARLLRPEPLLEGPTPQGVTQGSAILPALPVPIFPAPDVTPSATREGSTPSGTVAERPRVAVVAPTASAVSPDLRNVGFSILPLSAKLVLDGQDVGKWFGRTFQLPPGRHSLQITVPDSKCCKPLSDSAEVQPASTDDPNKVQMIVRKLEILPATVKLAGAPANAQYSCPSIGLVGYAGGSVTVKLPDALWNGKCQFTPPAQDAPRIRKSVTLRAGEENTVAWPATE